MSKLLDDKLEEKWMNQLNPTHINTPKNGRRSEHRDEPTWEHFLVFIIVFTAA